LGVTGRRRVRGIAAQSLFVGLLLMAANVRKIAAYGTWSPTKKGTRWHSGPDVGVSASRTTGRPHLKPSDLGQRTPTPETPHP
jgi:hypothetical protein